MRLLIWAHFYSPSDFLCPCFVCLIPALFRSALVKFHNQITIFKYFLHILHDNVFEQHDTLAISKSKARQKQFKNENKITSSTTASCWLKFAMVIWGVCFAQFVVDFCLHCGWPCGCTCYTLQCSWHFPVAKWLAPWLVSRLCVSYRGVLAYLRRNTRDFPKKLPFLICFFFAIYTITVYNQI